MGIQINGQTDTISATDGSLTVTDYELSVTSSINITGIITAGSFVGDLTGNLNSSGVSSITTLHTTNIKNPSFGSDTFVLDSSGNINIDSGGVYYDATNNRLAIGTTSPGAPLEVNGNVRITNANNLQLANTGDVQFLNAAGTSYSTGIIGSSDNMILYTTDLERARIDSSGRLLVGTSTSPSAGQGANSRLVVQGYVGDATDIGIMSIQRGEAATSITSGEAVGRIAFNDNAGNSFAYVEAYADANAGSGDYPGRLVFATTADGASSPTERMRISSTGGVRLPDVYNQTIALGANVFIDSDGTLKRATSSIKYKTNVETLEDQYADAVLNCRPVWYQSTSPGDNPNWGFWGFIAEEVAEIDPRLVQWKLVEQVINEDGSRDTVSLETPEPENVAYDRFVPHLLNLIKRQKEQIEAMEARLTALEQS